MSDNKNESDSGIELTETEAELYDRQIRLWGLESQKRLRTANILISGLNGLCAEITKNIILSGVNLVKLHDDKLVTEEDFCSQFLAPRESLGSNRAEASLARARALNPMVDISADTQPLSEKNADFFRLFDVIVISSASNEEILRIDAICRDIGVKLFVTDVWGTFGFHFASLLMHKYVEDVVRYKETSKPNGEIKYVTVSKPVQYEFEYPGYSKWLEFDFNATSYQRKLKRDGPGIILLRILQEFRSTYKRDPCYKTREDDIALLEKIREKIDLNSALTSESFDFLFAQISPAVAIVGAVVAQEVIKVVTRVEAPHRNLFIFNPQKGTGYVETVGVK